MRSKFFNSSRNLLGAKIAKNETICMLEQWCLPGALWVQTEFLPQLIWFIQRCRQFSSPSPLIVKGPGTPCESTAACHRFLWVVRMPGSSTSDVAVDLLSLSIWIIALLCRLRNGETTPRSYRRVCSLIPNSSCSTTIRRSVCLPKTPR